MPAHQPNYQHLGSYDHAIFQAEFAAQFGKSPRYNAGAMPDMLKLLGMIERDIGINDVRKAAYMLATVMWETTSPTTMTHAGVNKRGQPIVVKQHRWQMTMAPVSEIGQGKGRRYHEPVKVKLLADGSARITEQDGDQFKISRSGVITKLTKNASIGTKDGGLASKVYSDDDGVEQAYYGRGYVQLTWWSNYAAAGIAIGRGLDLLLDPELVKSPEVAYALMSHGMRTGKGFANGRQFSQYIGSGAANYVGARAMVNGNDHAHQIAAIAAKFETVLMKARGSSAPTTLPMSPLP